ncbi:MAG: hypothetical protein HUJ54_14805, partial [Erysipelotrichaceae bacterium]|nr:hypothetical protein [Erysipelotrichaceae bacterium]
MPVLLDENFPEKEKEETLFVFPFNHPVRSKEEAYRDIKQKLRNLSSPLLFLSHLESIEFEIWEKGSEDNKYGVYNKQIQKSLTIDGTICEQISLTSSYEDYEINESLWLFSRLDQNNRRYSIGYFMDDKGHLKPVNVPAFCFFPTKLDTNLKFIIHAAFLLTDSREGIKNVPYNKDLIQKLARLSADALIYMRDIGKSNSLRLIDDGIFSIIPIDQSKFETLSGTEKVSFIPFYEEIKHKFENYELIPGKDGYVSKENAYWAAVLRLARLFSDSQLGQITGNPNARWVFTSHGRDEIQRVNQSILNYLDSITRTYINEDAILKGRQKQNAVVDGKKITLESIPGINEAYIEKQSFEWMDSFYLWLSETKNRVVTARKKPFFLDQNRDAVPAVDDKE